MDPRHGVALGLRYLFSYLFSKNPEDPQLVKVYSITIKKPIIYLQEQWTKTEASGLLHEGVTGITPGLSI